MKTKTLIVLLGTAMTRPAGNLQSLLKQAERKMLYISATLTITGRLTPQWRAICLQVQPKQPQIGVTMPAFFTIHTPIQLLQ
jgi:hypothetical protein